MKKKLNLQDLNVDSFITTKEVIGGATGWWWCTDGCTNGCTAELCREETDAPCTGFICPIE